ncbi:hypothetical protein ACHAW5_004383, partial [Stephanodiscus triporus]
VVVATAAERGKNNDYSSQTCFTFLIPTNENASSILFGLVNKGQLRKNGPSKTSFNHDEVGITRPTTGVDPFPSCRGNTKNAIEDPKLLRELGSTTINGWRVLRYQKRVGFGKNCYRRVRQAVLDWDFEAHEGNKYMGILPVETSKKAVDFCSNEAGRSFFERRHLLATFTGISFPRPLKSLFVVNPVHVVYEVKDSRIVQTCLFTTAPFATLTGHLVAVEILSYSRPAPSIKGKFIWPLIGRTQQQFFLCEIHHLDKIAKDKI